MTDHGSSATGSIEVTAETDLNFGHALAFLREGKSVTRLAWPGPDQYLSLRYPDNIEHMNLPFIYITTRQDGRVPWAFSQTDILATDWQVIR